MNLLRTERDTLDGYIPGWTNTSAIDRCWSWSNLATAPCRYSASWAA